MKPSTVPRTLEGFKTILESKESSFSKSQKKIAQYLLAHYEHAAFQSLSELAQHTGTSESTLVRFAIALGFDGFPGLKQFLQDVFREKFSPAVRMQTRLEDLKKRNQHFLPQIVEMETHYLAEILNTVPLENFDRAVQILLEGKNLFLFGIGHSRILVELLQMRLQRLGIHTICLVEAGRDLLDKLLLLRKDDAVLIAAYHRITGELTAVLRHAQRVGCRTVILTDIPELESYRKADVVLYALRGPVHSFHSHVVPMAILNALVLAITAEQGDTSFHHLKLLEQMRLEYGLDPLGELP